MTSRATLILFVKVPRLGQVKTRLAKTVGAGEAKTLYRRISLPVIRRLARDRRWRTVLAVTPDRGVWRDWPRRTAAVPQGRGGLGQRMGRLLRFFAAPAAVLIGTDIPEASPAAVAEAFQRLRRADFVFGPAHDGGYWLIGWRRAAAWPSRALKDVRWSTTCALSDTLSGLRGRRVGWARVLSDVDDEADVRQWRRKPASLPSVRGRPP